MKIARMLVLALLACAPPASARAAEARRLHLERLPRVVVMVPHPDDETLGAGGLIKRVTDLGGKLLVVYLTTGDSFPQALKKSFHVTNPTAKDFIAFGEVRRGEALNALGVLGVRPANVIFLGFPESGLDQLWAEHWLATDPYTSPYNGQNHPPYPDSFDPNAMYTGTNVVDAIEKILKGFSPTTVVMPHPYDGQCDHIATASFVLTALENLEKENSARRRPRVLTYLIHHPLWPHGPHLGMDGSLSPPPQSIVPDTTWYTLPLTVAEVEAKSQAIHSHQTQMAVMDRFLVHFVRTNEVFGVISRRLIATVVSRHSSGAP